MEESAVPSSLEDDQLRPLCSLDDPTRRRLYAYAAAAGKPITRDQASAALEIDRSLVAYHLDKLADEGLLVTSFARPEGRRGPGAGRPTKQYQRGDREISVSVPPRDYQLAAELLARAVESDPSGTVRRSLDRAAAELGRESIGTAPGAGTTDLTDELRRRGFEPYDDDGVIRLRNCPFDRLAREHTDLICGMNLAMLKGIVKALAADVRVRLDPAPNRCCVALERR